MKSCRKICLILLVLGVWWLPGRGEVYLLWPFQGKATVCEKLGALPGSGQRLAYQTKVEINGTPCELEVYSFTGELAVISDYLKKAYPTDNITAGKGTIRLNYALDGQTVERILLVFSANADGKCTMFRLITPKELPPPGNWPGELPPLPAGAVIDNIMRFDKGGVYGSFKNAGQSPEELLKSTVGSLRSQHWVTASNESAFGGSGELLVRSGGKELCWVDFGEDGHGIMYYKLSK